MGVENSCTRVRVTFTREFPPECGDLTSQLPPLKRFYTYIRDFPPGCGPLAAKTTPFYPVKSSVKTVNLGSKPGPGPRPGPSSGLGSAGFNLVKREKFESKPVLGSGSGSGLGSRAFRSGGGEAMRGKSFLGSGSGLGLGLGSGFGVKREGKVKVLDTIASAGKNEVTESKNVEGVSKERVKVVEMLKLFRRRCDELSKRGVKRVDIEANRELTREGKLMKQGALNFGDIPGVEVGDKFYYRIELVIVGLHRLFQGGIDSMEYGGDRCATCIVASEGHLDKMSDPNVLIYGGEGGTLKRNEVGVPPDQQLIAGNRALDNSRIKKMDVRVVRGLRYGAGNAKVMYVYDGLYHVVDTRKKKGPQGNMVYEFLLTRNAGQPAVPWREYRRALV